MHRNTDILAPRLLLTILALVSGGIEAAEMTDADQQKVTLDDLTGRLDLSIPQSPAFTILGVAPDKIVQSDDFRTVAAGLLTGLDPNGNLQKGIAIDVRPYLLASGKTSTLHSYRTSRLVRAASRSQLSFATASGSSDSDRADRQALGLNMKLWLQHDPAMGTSLIRAAGLETSETLDDCYARYLSAASSALPELPETDEELSEAEGVIASKARLAVTKCLAPFKEQHWNSGSIELAVAGHRSKDKQIDESGFGAWISASYGIGTLSQIISRASYTENMLVPVKNQAGAYEVVDESNAGLRLRVGSSRGAITAEGLWTRSHSATVDEKYWRASVGTELMILRDVWIQFAVGKAFSTVAFEKDPVYSGQIRFGFSERSLFSTK